MLTKSWAKWDEGTVNKTVPDKILDKPEEEQEKIFKDYGFLKEKVDKLIRENNEELETEDQKTDGSAFRPDAAGNTEGPAAGSQKPNQQQEFSPEELAEQLTANIQNRVSDAVSELIGKMPERIVEAIKNRYVDPVVVDLDRDGEFVTSLADGVHFDLNGDGFAEKTAWISRGDGLLVRDVNGNGKIDDGTELFGDQTIKKDGTTAKSGFEALAELDSNGDGILDSSDSEFDSMKIWMDFDRNGISNKNELFTLKEFGIISIDLGNRIISQMDQYGNLIKSQSIMGGGDTGFHINEYGFSVDYVDTWYKGEEIDTSVLPDGLPDIKGCGTLISLAEAMVKNGKLLELVNTYVNEQDSRVKSGMVEDILFAWTGADQVDADSRGSRMNAKKLHVVEQVYGQKFVGTSGPNPIVGAAAILNELYDSIHEDIEKRLLVQTVYREALESICITYNKATESFEGDFAEPIIKISEKYSRQYAKWFVNDLLENTDVKTCFGREYIAEQLKGKDEELRLFILADKFFAGGDAADNLSGTSGNDLLYGRIGNDKLNGGYGDDIYVFSFGDGDDVIYDNGGTDRIVFGEGILAEDLRFRRKGLDLHITNEKSGDHILVKDMYYNGSQQVESVEFADGTVWTAADIADRVRYHDGTDGDDTISTYEKNPNYVVNDNDVVHAGAGNDTVYTGNGDDEIHGEEGNDTINAGNGNDLLDGGKGNDTLNGGNGDDTYLFNLGDGNDVIYDTAGNDKILFGENITKEDLVFSRSNNDLCISVMGTDQSIVNSNYYYSPQYRIEEIQTSDGYALDCQKLDLVIQTMAGCEDETGMSWQDAVEQDSQYTKDLMDQWWIQKTE